MRTVPDSIVQPRVRIINGRAVIKNRLPVFETRTDRSLMYYAHDVVVRGSKIHRVINGSSDSGIAPTLYTQEIEFPNGTHPGLINTGVNLKAGSGVALSTNYIFMQRVNGDIVRRSISDAGTITIENFSFSVGLAAVSDTEFYVFYPVSTTTYRIAFYNTSGVVSTWHGSVYGERFAPGPFDAERIGNADYIVFGTHDGKNARIIKRVNNSWGDSEGVFPIDVVDDTSQFRLGGISVIDSRLVVTGVITRPDYRMKIYSFGPEHFSLGREMFVAEGKHVDYALSVSGESTSVDGSPGKMILFNDWLYVFGGDGEFHEAKSTVLFGSDRSDQKAGVGIVDVNFNTEANRPAQATFEIPVADCNDLVAAGNILEWYATVNNVEVKLGTFSIDFALDNLEASGETVSLIGRSLGGKNLSAWNSDSSFDYWSQTKQSSQVSDMAEVIRGSGLWDNGFGDESYVTLRDFNQEGILYTVERSTRNGVAVGEFRVDPVEGFSGKYGVAIAYFRETPQDAAARLGQETAGDADCFNHGFFFVVDSLDGSTTLYSVFDNQWRVLETGSAVSPVGWHWLRVEFHEGRIRCAYRAGTSWVEVIDHEFVSDVGNPLPWFRDEVGKAAIYVENNSANAEVFGFSSQDSVIPVVDNSVFPLSDIVQVDSEKIRYSGKSPNIDPVGPLVWADGKAYKNAPHGNPYDFPEMVISSVDAPVAYANTYENDLLCGTFVSSDYWVLTKLEFYVSKVGSPANLQISLGTDAVDNYGNTLPSSAIKATAVLSAPSSGAQWVTVTLSTPVKLQPDQAYFMLLHNTGQTSSDYYRVWHEPNVGKRRHLYRTWKPWRTDEDITMCFRAYGHGPNYSGYSIFFEGIGEPLGPEYYKDCTLVITDGPGKGKAYKILAYDYIAPHQWKSYTDVSGWESFVGETSHGEWEDRELRRFFVSEDPSRAFTPDTRAMVVPSLIVSHRGILFDDFGEEISGEYLAAAHSDGICSIFRRASVCVRSFQYFSGCKDWRLEDMMAELAGKANVLDISCEKRLSGSGIGNGEVLDTASALSEAVEGESAIVKFRVNSWSSGGIGLAVFPPDTGDYAELEMAAVVVRQNQIDFYQGDAPALVESFPLIQAIKGEFVISFQRTNFSIWNNDKFLCHFDWPESSAEESTLHTGFKIGVLTSGPISYFVDWSVLDQRVDNYIFDIGQSGHALATSLIGEKRVYFLDDADGNLRLFRTHTVVNPDEPTDLHISSSITQADIDVRTRLRVEGAEITETVNYEALSKYGNRFALIGLREANNIVEARREADLIQQDHIRSFTQIPLQGAMDLRLEPGDVVEVYYEDGKRLVLIEGMSVRMNLNEKSATFDMTIDGVEYV